MTWEGGWGETTENEGLMEQWTIWIKPVDVMEAMLAV